MSQYEQLTDEDEELADDDADDGAIQRSVLLSASALPSI